DWIDFTPYQPRFSDAVKVVEFDIAVLRDYIDWTPFFITWEFRGRYPQILEDETVGKEATELYNDAQKMLQDIIDNKTLTAKGVYNFWKANTNDRDTIYLYDNNSQP